MTPEQLSQVEALYFRVRDLPPDQRAGALADEPEEAVRSEVQSLLGPVPAAFLATPALGADVITDFAGPAEPDPLVGSDIGPYRVEKLLGAGGMGAVYLASRADGAFDQRVAIKVVKRGMDTDEILRRFRAERRTLAALRHPNIAAVLDGGSLPDGRPYLVMEYIDGRPINAYGQERRLGTPERLRLFMAVCSAVQFAHQNLIVHRDLKPGNILVTEAGAPKLLDFGIAKVLAPEPAATMTGLELRRFTPEYASPEQVQGRPVTTGSDVYSLGVILYELLAGRPPYQFETRSTAEIQRIVTGVAPPPPSTAVLQQQSARADASPARLRRELRGDLDTIVLMAIHKEPARRYASAEQLAADIDRCLKGLPVIARRDTFAYRSAKFLRRHALASAAAAAAAILLSIGIAGVAWQARVARHERDDAFIARDQQEAVAKFLHDILASADPFGAGSKATVRQVLDTAADRIQGELRDQPLVQARIRSTIGMAYLGLGDYDTAEKHIRGAYDQRLAILGPGAHDVAESKVDLAALLYARGRLNDAEPLLREALVIFRHIRGNHNIDVARVLSDLGVMLRGQNKIEEAADTLRQAIEMRERESGPMSLELAESLNNYAGVLRAQGHPDQAEATMTRSLDIRLQLLGEHHPLVAIATANLAVMVHAQGDLSRAESIYKRAIDLEVRSLGPDHPEHAATLSSYGTLLASMGDQVGAESALRDALRIRLSGFPPADARVLRTQILLADCLASLSRFEEADTQYRAAVIAVESGVADAASAARVCERAAAFYEQRGDQVQGQRIRSLIATRPSR